MANCYAKECPHGKQCVSIAPNYYLYDCEHPPAPPPTTQLKSPSYPSTGIGTTEILTLAPPKVPSGEWGSSVTSIIAGIFNEIKETISNFLKPVTNIFTGSNNGESQALSYNYNPSGGFLIENEAVRPKETTKMPTGTLDPNAVITESVNKRGGEQKATPSKVYNILGHEISIPQAMIIPIGIATLILVLVIFRWI